MNTSPIQGAAPTFHAQGVPLSARAQQGPLPPAEALAQARFVSIAGNGLPTRWQGLDRFVVLQTGFDRGHHFLATWQAWRDDPQRCTRLVVIAIEEHPPSRDELARVHAASPLPDLASALTQAWPPLTANLHTLRFDDGRVQLMLAVGNARDGLRELVATVDAFDLHDPVHAADPHPWDERVCKALGRLAAPGATLVIRNTATDLRMWLTTAGFDVRVDPGTDGERGVTIARYAPSYTPRRAPARNAARESAERHALIVGGGLAGCAAAWALAEQGWRSTLIERHTQIASEASGNPGGLFHGIVNAQDGVHARFNRAAALAASQAVQVATARHGVAGQLAGLLRLNTDAGIDVPGMRAMLQGLGASAEFVQALSADQASALSGIALQHPAWLYPGGGWVDPAGLARAFIERAGGSVAVRTGVAVHAVHAAGSGWTLVDAAGGTIAEASTLVLANAGAAMSLLGEPGWPVEPVRGQISLMPSSAFALPRVPIAGSGYVLPAFDGMAMFGATAQRLDDDPSVRHSDHLENLQQLARLTGHPIDPSAIAWSGRTAWRWSSVDRLPVIGAVPVLKVADLAGRGDAALSISSPGTRRAPRLDQPRFVPRLPGLFVFTALGSRGITWSALGAQVLASGITGAPAPLEADLLDAIDPARFISRAVRRAPGS